MQNLNNSSNSELCEPGGLWAHVALLDALLAA